MDSVENEIEILMIDAKKHKEGLDVEIDLKKMFESYQKASKLGSSKATSILGYLYDHGIYVNKNYDTAMNYYQKAAVAGDPVAQYNYAAYKYDEGDYSQAIEGFLKSSSQGYSTADVFLGTLYQRGHGVEISLEKAAHYYLKAASKNNPHGLFRLALCYRDGRGVQKDHSEMLALLKKAASLDFSRAWVELGNTYLEGIQPSDDPQWAMRECYFKAAELGSVEAQQWCGEALAMGIGCESDPERAIPWLENAIQEDCVRAKYIMAILLARGDGIEKNIERAIQLCKEAAKKGEKGAQQMLKNLSQ